MIGTLSWGVRREEGEGGGLANALDRVKKSNHVTL